MSVGCRAVKSTKGKVISDKDLEILLDRSDLLGKLRFLFMYSVKHIRHT